jgi:hypothetical protein
MSKTNGIKWLDRRISEPGPYLCLCLSEREYRQAMKHCKVTPVDQWIKTPQSDATAHTLAAPHGLCVVVCLSNYEKRTGVEIAGLLIHEAVHAWQEWCEYYGERHPASEQEAYAIQGIAQELMAEYARRTHGS